MPAFTRVRRVLPGAFIPWLIYVGAVALTCPRVTFGKPFTHIELFVGCVATLAWAVLAASAVAVVTELLLAALPATSRIGAVGRAFLWVAVPLIPILSVVKLALVGQHLRGTDLAYFVRYRPWQDPIAAVVAVGSVGLIALLAWRTHGGGRRRESDTEEGSWLATLAPGGIAAVAFFTLLIAGPRTAVFAQNYLPEVVWITDTMPSRDAFVHWPRPDLADDKLAGEKIHGWPAPDAIADKLNVVIIMIDGVRHQHLGIGGGPDGVTPNIDALAARSVVFTRAYTASAHSDYAQTSLVAGLHPRKYRGHDFFDRGDPRTPIWDVLKPLGYATSFVSTHNERWGSMERFMRTDGVDFFKHAPDWPNAPTKGRGHDTAVPERFVVNEWKRWRKAHPGPHVSYLNFQVTHFPYTLPPGAARPFQPDRGRFDVSFVSYPKSAVPVMRNRFYNALHHADHWVGEVLSLLRERGELKRTLVVVVSDHGEAFYEHHNPTHGTDLLEEQVGSMLVVHVPGAATRVDAQPVSLVDVVPSVLRELGVARPPMMQGADDILRPDPRPSRDVYFTIQGLASMDGMVRGRWKFIADINRRTTRLFDLDADPSERANLAQSRPEVAAWMHNALNDFIDRQLAFYDRKLWKQRTIRTLDAPSPTR